MKIYRPKYCECLANCGREVKPGRRFIHNHNHIGTHHSKETLRIMSKSQIIAQNRPEIREKKSKSGTITQNRPEVIEKRSKSEKIAQNRPETIERHSKSGKITQTKPNRTG